MHFKLALIGFGVVGQGLIEILEKSRKELKTQNFEFTVVAIADKIKGSLYHPDGLELRQLQEIVEKTGKISDYQGAAVTNWNSLETIQNSNADIIIEVTWTDLQTGEPALTYVKTALSLGKHVVMTNKGPVALEAMELFQLAKKHNVQLKFEGTVLSGTPAINLGLYNLAGAKIKQIQGILNGTTNYILTEMEKGLSYEKALQQAQELGYAETDPTGDVEGWDALGKIVILTNVVLGHPLTKADVNRKGITNITSEDIQKAKNEGKRWKLIASTLIQSDGTIQASVRPEKLPMSHPLANISGVTNALLFQTEYAGDITIIGPGAGRLVTGFALLTDLLEINRIVSK